jgi:hypothetical protein
MNMSHTAGLALALAFALAGLPLVLLLARLPRQDARRTSHSR